MLGLHEWVWIAQLMASMKGRGFISLNTPTAAELTDGADDGLFATIKTNERHVLHRLFPLRPHSRYELRPSPRGSSSALNMIVILYIEFYLKHLLNNNNIPTIPILALPYLKLYCFHSQVTDY